ncbi:Ribosomal protein S24e [mine drainage metagenome]|uniref:Ribosomal protein S24e n=1 Tax=mine drainage metagenome TaxID=410659 RepID=T1BN94_9ZZZZ
MEIRLVDQRPNPLLHRQELRFEVAHATAPTPGREEVRAEIAKQVGVAKDRVVVERMQARFGTATTVGEAMVYESTDIARRTEREHILIRNKLKEKPGAAPPAESAPPAPPAKEA